MSRLGRNPFDKKPLRAVDFVKQMEAAASTGSSPTSESASEGVSQKLARFVLVDVRAESYLFGLKAYLLSISFFQ